MKTKKPTIERQIIEGLESFAGALEQGDDIAKRFTCHKVVFDLKTTVYSPALVKETRETLRLSQVLFAKFLGISPSTVRAWEQGEKSPQPIACRFMDEIRSEPERWLARLKRSMRLKAVR
jgi:putative transcriptional regulator